MTGNLQGIQKTASIFVHQKLRQRKDEKRRIFKMCLNKMRSIDSADSILYKHVLIKNTLIGIQKNQKDLHDISDTEEDSKAKNDITCPSFIEKLLNEIDLSNGYSPKSSLPLENRTSTQVKRESLEIKHINYQKVLEDFHNNEAIGQTKIILDEDSSKF
eukprot:GFUD01036707.1.p1 GENE.GFUD01036707.1~~GFUD01036707.1.p1  ORF type:complete len:159 (+),score=36.74 GFUD01036707.1:50-526(+)